MTDIRTEIMTITPTQAHEWLGLNTHNRNLRTNMVERLAGVITRGEWHLNGESIKINGKTLIDGQHRLAAIVEADMPAVSVVIFGIPLDSQETIDIGTRRTLGDMLRLRGEVSGTILGSAIGWLHRWRRGDVIGRMARDYPTPQEAMTLLDANPGLRQGVAAGRLLGTHIPVIPSLLAFLYYIFAEISPEDADDFFDKLQTGADLGANDPIFVLRASLLREITGSRRSRETFYHAAIIVKAWNAYREGRSVTNLRWTPGGSKAEPFPVPV